MARRSWLLKASAPLAAAALLLGGCFDEPPVPDSATQVFDDAFPVGIEPFAFENSLLTSLSIDSGKAYAGQKSIRLEIPPAASGYSGGAVLASNPLDLSGENALVFWATSSRDAIFDQLGFGLNFTPYPSTYRVTLLDLPLTPEWTQHVVPIPDPSRLTAERGMFWWAEGDATAYTAWLDDVKFARVDPAALAMAPATGTATRTILVGGTAQAGGLRVDYRDLDGTPRSVAAPGYFSFASSATSVARVDATGRITGVGLGHAVITARAGTIEAAGGIPVDVVASLPTAPAAAPARPAVPAADVISLWSAAYANHPVDTWRTSWSAATQTDVTVGADPVKLYTSLNFAGIEFAGANAVDATSMTAFHLDVWTPNATAIRVKLVDYGADAAGGTGDETEHELTLDGGSTPDVAAGSWVSLELPLGRFTGLASRAHLGLLVLSASPAGSATLYVDNVYFHR